MAHVREFLVEISQLFFVQCWRGFGYSHVWGNIVGNRDANQVRLRWHDGKRWTGIPRHFILIVIVIEGKNRLRLRLGKKDSGAVTLHSATKISTLVPSSPPR